MLNIEGLYMGLNHKDPSQSSIGGLYMDFSHKDPIGSDMVGGSSRVGETKTLDVHINPIRESSIDKYKGKLEGCGKRFLVLECQGNYKNDNGRDEDCKVEYPIPLLCGLRTCPTCAGNRSFDLYKEICEIVSGLKFNNLYRLRHIVLTWGTEGSVDHRVQKTLKAFVKLWRNYLKPLSVGAVMSLELGSKNGSVHLHILFYGLYVDVEDLRKKWFELTGKFEVWINEISPGAKGRKGIREALKYATKGVCSDLSLGYEIERALKKVRRVRRYGIFYVYEAKKGISYEEKYKDFFEDKTPVFVSDFVCPLCGSLKWKLKRDVSGGILCLDCAYDFDRLEVLNMRYCFGVFRSGALLDPILPDRISLDTPGQISLDLIFPGTPGTPD